MKQTGEAKLLMQPVGRILGSRRVPGGRKREQRSGTCFFVREITSNRTLAVTSSHVLQDVEQVEIQVVANSSGTGLSCSYKLDLETVVHPSSPDQGDICVVDVTILEATLAENGFGDGPLHVDLAETTSQLGIRGFSFCSFEKDAPTLTAKLFHGGVGVDPEDPTVTATLRIEESGEMVFIGSPPKGTSGSPVWVVDESDQVHFVGMLTGRCKLKDRSVDELAIVLPRQAVIDFINAATA